MDTYTTEERDLLEIIEARHKKEQYFVLNLRPLLSCKRAYTIMYNVTTKIYTTEI